LVAGGHGDRRDATTTGTITVNARLALADFVLSSTDISVALAHPRVGQAVSVIVTVRNIGLQGAVDVLVSLSDARPTRPRPRPSAFQEVAWRRFHGLPCRAPRR